MNGEALGKGDIHSILDNCITRPCSAVGDADDDNDDVCNAFDICPGADDKIDLNCDGTPDACDNAQVLDQCEILPFDPDTASFVLGFHYTPKGDDPKEWLFYNFDEAGGIFTQYDDGTANYQGIIINDLDPEDRWKFCMNFENKMDWEAWEALGRSYKVRGEGCTEETHLALDYYEISSSSKMIGLGTNAGLLYDIGHYPTDYSYGAQLGNGGHNSAPNCDYSIGAWFNITRKNGSLIGKGDIHSIINCAISLPLPVDLEVMLQGPAEEIDSTLLEVDEIPRPQFGTGTGNQVANRGASNTIWAMKDDLRSEGLIPAQQPFGTLSNFNYNGNETIEDNVLEITGKNAIIDWILVEFRDENDPTQIVDTKVITKRC